MNAAVSSSYENRTLRTLSLRVSWTVLGFRESRSEGFSEKYGTQANTVDVESGSMETCIRTKPVLSFGGSEISWRPCRDVSRHRPPEYCERLVPRKYGSPPITNGSPVWRSMNRTFITTSGSS